MKKIIYFFILLILFTNTAYLSDNSGSISGYILDKMTKEPINAAKITIYGSSVLTDKQGYFTVSDIPKGNIIIEIDAIDHKRYINTISIVNGEVFEKIYLEPSTDSIVVMGIIKDKVRNRPIPNAKVSLDNQIVKTNSSGKYRLSGVSPGKKIIDIIKRGYETYTEKVFVDEMHRVLNISLLPNIPFGIVYGKIINTMTSKPVRGALIQIGSYKSVTGLDGSYKIKGLEPGQHSLKIKAYNYKTTIDSIQIVAAKKKMIFKLMPEEKYGVIEGIVKSIKNSNAIAGAEINIGGNKSIAGIDGSFIVSDISVGAQDVQCIHPDYKDYNEKIIISEGKQNFVIVMTPQTRFGNITGTVKDKNDMFPIKEAKVSCGGKFVYTDNYGKFILKDIVTGKNIIQINAKGYKISQNQIDIEIGTQLFNIFIEKQIEAGIMTKKEFVKNVLNHKEKKHEKKYFVDIPKEKNINIKTEKILKGSIEGIIIDDLTGKPIKGADVMIDDKITKTDNTGKYQVKFLKYGNHKVTVITDKNEVFVNKAVIDNVKNTFNIKLCTKLTKGTVYGKIYDETTEMPLSNVKLTLGNKVMTSDEDGKYQFSSIKEDFYNFSAEYHGFSKYVNIIKVKDGSLRLDIYLKRIK